MLNTSDKVFLLQLMMLLILSMHAESRTHLAIIIGVYGGMIGLWLFVGKKNKTE